MASYYPPPGTDDILPGEVSIWQFMEKTAAKVFSLYGFEEIRTPIFEYTEIFSKGIGEQTEVVQKEMYTFQDKGGRSLTLRPEGTAGIIRALASLAQQGNNPRVFYVGPMFRGERPAAGRKRQFHQIGVENISSPSPELDAECIVMMMNFLKEIGIDGASLKINTRGDAEDRALAGAKLREILSNQRQFLCEDCTKRFDRNVWRILDCKNPKCGEIFSTLPGLDGLFSDKSQSYLSAVLEILSGENIRFEKDSRLVRGLDYYAHTVFEIVHHGLGAQNAIAGGGRYEIIPPEAKNPICGVGFACGLERLIMAAVSEGSKKMISKTTVPVFMVSIGKDAMRMNFSLAQRLRDLGIPVVADFEERSMKSAMRAAGKSGAKITVIRGDNEIRNKTIIVKNMADGSQSEVSEQSATQEIKKLA
ncbi:MAG TPA: histidine--tRNA ligase [Victivallales bacterium]|nr:histidine--tRNA ligase [Victivallales bacterium]